MLNTVSKVGWYYVMYS